MSQVKVEFHQTDLNKRKLLKAASVGGAALAIAPGIKLFQAAHAKADEQAVSDKNRWGLLIDVNRCADGCNDCVDAWFIGFSSDLAVGVYVGFDQPKSLGRGEYGATAALPIWKAFMKAALKDRPDIPFRKPSGIKLVRIDYKTGMLPNVDTPPNDIIFESSK